MYSILCAILYVLCIAMTMAMWLKKLIWPSSLTDLPYSYIAIEPYSKHYSPVPLYSYSHSITSYDIVAL